jgi:hypothetical protein
MSYVSERHSDLIITWIERRISSDEFARRYPISAHKLDELGPRILNAALATQDAFDLEYGLLVGFQRGMTRAYLPSLLQLANAPWHRQHENIVSALDELLAPESVDELYRVALSQHAYRSQDKARTLAVAAIAALGSIADCAAIAALGQLLHSGQHILEKQSAKQLQRIATTATMPEHKQAARAALGPLGLDT